MNNTKIIEIIKKLRTPVVTYGEFGETTIVNPTSSELEQASILEQIIRKNTVSLTTSEIDVLKRTRDVLSEHPYRFLMAGCPTGNSKPRNTEVISVIDKVLNIINDKS